MRKMKYRIRTSFILVILIVIGIFSISLGYSTFFTSMDIKQQKYWVRLDRGIRITANTYSSANNALPSYEEYNEHTLAYGFKLNNNTSSIKYKVEIINFTNELMGIFEITGLPSELTYSIDGYTEKTKMCDTNNNCTSGMKKVIYITISYANTSIARNPTDYYVELNVDFRNVRKVTLDKNGGTSLSPTLLEIMDGDLYGTIPTPTVPDIRYRFDGWYTQPSGGSEIVSTTVMNNNADHIIYAHWYQICTYFPNDYWDFSSNSVQTFSTPCNGEYTLEVWGAQGGDDSGTGGKGGYSTGAKDLTKNTNLYVVVGGQGTSLASGNGGGYNGGGNAGSSGSSGGGGGATHIATSSGLLASLSGNTSSVLIVAGGGGGAGGSTSGGAGGGTNGSSSGGGGGTQSSGGTGNYAGSFGAGGNRGTTLSTSTYSGSTSYTDRTGVVAWSFTASASGTVTFQSTSHTSDPYGFIYVNDTQVCANDDGAGNLDFLCTATVNSGDSVVLRAGAYSSAGSCSWQVTYPTYVSGAGGGGGGGWYGGGAPDSDSGGGGGSGYIGGVKNGSMSSGVRSGSGKARITINSFYE